MKPILCRRCAAGGIPGVECCACGRAACLHLSRKVWQVYRLCGPCNLELHRLVRGEARRAVSPPPVVVLACGAAKHDLHGAPAHQLYRGALFVLALTWARSVAPLDRIFILSAKYGLIRSTDPIDVYDVRISDARAVTSDQLAQQAAALGLSAAAPIFQGGAEYATRLRPAIPGLVWLVDRMHMPGRGIGYQLAWLKRNVGRLPA